MKPRGKFTTKENHNEDGEIISHTVMGTKMDGTRPRPTFKTTQEADLECARLTDEALNEQGVAPNRRSMHLSRAEYADAVNANQIKPRDVTLTTLATKEAKKKPSKRSAKISVIYDEYKKWVYKDENNPRISQESFRDRKNAKDRFMTDFGDITSDEIVDLDFQCWQAPDKSLRSLSPILTWATRQRPPYMTLNPLLAVLKTIEVKQKTSAPEIIPVEPELQLMLDASANMFDGLLFGPFVEMIWAVMRTKETARQSMDLIHFEERKVSVPARIGKPRKSKQTDLMPNAHYMLGRCRIIPGYSFKKAYVNFANHFDALKEAALFIGVRCPKCYRQKDRKKMKPWPYNGPRHSGLTFHALMTGNFTFTAAWGRTSVPLLGRCYLGESYDRFAVIFWLMLPTGTSLKDRVVVYFETIVHLLGTRLKYALKRYLLEKGVSESLCPKDFTRWNPAKIARQFAKIKIAQEAKMPPLLFLGLPTKPVKWLEFQALPKAAIQRQIDETPASQLRNLLGVSDTAIAKFCLKRHGIKMKPRGFWEKERIQKLDAKIIKLAQTMSRSDAAHQIGVSADYLRKRAKAMGISFISS